MIPLLITLVSGLFFLVGIIIYKYSKNKDFLTMVSLACAIVIIIGLIIFDLIPELISFKHAWIFLFIALGLIFLLAIDAFIPHHSHKHHEHDEKTKEHLEHNAHIGIITIIALLLHNLIEGMALYSLSVTNLKSGILMCLAISLHNLPLGLQIAALSAKKKPKLLLFLLIFSGFLGGLIASLIGILNSYIEAIIIAITIGMISYILIFELIPEVLHNKDKKETLYGIIIGIGILVIINLI